MNRALPLLLLALLSAGCGGPSGSSPAPKADPTTEAWYPQTTERLANMDRAADQLFQAGRNDEAAAIVQSALPMQTRLLAAPRPTLEAMQAIADLDRIYGKMLVSNGYFGEARLLFQKNITRWKTWKPQTPDTERRLKEANTDIAECDKHMGG
jgi:Flp pilus assembly protein TadD